MSRIRATSSVTATLAALALAAAPSAPAAPGDLDAGFGTGGVVFSDADLVKGSTFEAGVAVQPDGKVIAIDRGLSDNVDRVHRYLPDGTPDDSFGTHGVADIPGNTDASKLALQRDGKIVVAGVKAFGFGVSRLNADGSPDQTFDGDSGNGNGSVAVDPTPGLDVASDLALDSKDRIVVAGEANVGDQSGGEVLVRLLPGGELDKSFHGGGILVSDVGIETSFFAVATQADDKIVATGRYGSFPIGDTFVQRFTEAGQFDAGFGGSNEGRKILDLSTEDDGHSIAIQPSGRILVGVDIENADNDRVLAFTPAGQLDPAFAAGGNLPIDFDVRDIVPTADGKLLLAGGHGGGEVRALAFQRRNGDGTADPTLANGATVIRRFSGDQVAQQTGAAVGPDGKLIIAGRTESPIDRGALARFQLDPDPAPAPAAVPPADTGGSQPITQPVIQPAPLPALALTKLSLTHRRFAVARGATAFRYTLNRAATVSIRIKRLNAGARGGTIKRTSRAGANRVRFSGRIGRRALKPGSYRATVVATEASGVRSKPVTIRFRVVRG